jgi:uncharacterized protein (TIGR02996 family)
LEERDMNDEAAFLAAIHSAPEEDLQLVHADWLEERGDLKDVANAIEELNGRPTAQARLLRAIGELRQQDSPELRREFRRAYADLPAYLRTYIFGSRMQKYTDLQRLLESEE